LPFSKIQLSYRDINTKEQLVLSKANIYFPSDDEHDAEYAKALKSIVSNCVENKEDFFKLNLIDYILFVTKLKIVTNGNQLDIEYSDQESNQKIKMTLDLLIFMRILYETASKVMKNNTIRDKNIKVTLGWPSINSEELFLNSKEKGTDFILSTISEYIKTVSIDDTNFINLENFNTNQKNTIYESLPIRLRDRIQNFVFDSIKAFSEINLFNLPRMDYFKFNLYNKNYINLFRLFFSLELKSIYQDYYKLASKNIDPFYVDTMPISDRKVFSSFVDEEIKTRSESSSNDGSTTSLDDLIGEFEG
jgi:hypothetical protein